MSSAVFSPTTSLGNKGSQRRRATSSVGKKPSTFGFYLALVVLGVGSGVVLGLPLVDGTLTELKGKGGAAIFLGSVTGLLGTYLALVMVILASRTPILERVLGQVGVIKWHRSLAPWPIVLLSAHAVLLTLGYAEAANSGVVKYLGVLFNTFPHLVTATIALGIMVVIGLISIKPVRESIPREYWWLVHLLMYLALILAFAHEVVLGPSFVGHPLAQETWTGAWIIAGVLVAFNRVLVPSYRSFKHKLKVVEIEREGPNVVSVIMEGQDLNKLKISGGQFMEWRFLTKGRWWQAHPFTVSARPRGQYIRITVKAVGDFSSDLAKIPVGTKVFFEGPYGSFTTHSAKVTEKKIAIFAGGVGVTAARALIEDLPSKSAPTVIYRVSSEEDLVLLDELAELVKYKKGSLHTVVGSRGEVTMEDLVKKVEDLRDREIFISGSDGFVEELQRALLRVGVSFSALHEESYSL